MTPQNFTPDFFSLTTLFDAKATEFNAGNALFLAKSAALSYQDKAFIQLVVQDVWQFPHFRFIEYLADGMDTEVVVMANDEAIVVTFRGTEPNLEDWVTNLSTDARPAFNVEVHQGFMEAFESIQEPLWKTIDELNTNEQTIWFCGHSQGGALAMLATAQLQFWNQSINGLYTFGQPRVGNDLFSYWFDGTCKSFSFRIANANDVVVDVPTEKRGFRHAGTLVFFDESGEMIFDKDTFQIGDKDVFDWLDSLVDFMTENMEAHKTETYIHNLTQYVGKITN